MSSIKPEQAAEAFKYSFLSLNPYHWARITVHLLNGSFGLGRLSFQIRGEYRTQMLYAFKNFEI